MTFAPQHGEVVGLVYEPRLGAWLEDVKLEMQVLADAEQKAVTGTFNGLAYKASPRAHAVSVVGEVK